MVGQLRQASHSSWRGEGTGSGGKSLCYEPEKHVCRTASYVNRGLGSGGRGRGWGLLDVWWGVCV